MGEGKRVARPPPACSCPTDTPRRSWQRRCSSGCASLAPPAAPRTRQSGTVAASGTSLPQFPHPMGAVVPCRAPHSWRGGRVVSGHIGVIQTHPHGGKGAQCRFQRPKFGLGASWGCGGVRGDLVLEGGLKGVGSCQPHRALLRFPCPAPPHHRGRGLCSAWGGGDAEIPPGIDKIPHGHGTAVLIPQP